MNASKTLDIESNGIVFCVRIVEKGDTYGLNNCLTHTDSEPLVEFYDKRFPHTEYGQFVSRYNLTTLLKMKKNLGLNLQGGVPDWSVNAQGMKEVLQWLEKFEIVEAT